MKKVLKNAYIVNGEKDWEIKKGDIVINGDKIEDVVFNGNNDYKNFEVIDVSGFYVSPGFIDVHSHSDLTLLVHPEAESAISQGVTTVISGNCGFSVCPVDKTLENIISEAKLYGVEEVKWRSLREYLDYVSSLDIAINYAYLVGHGQIRAEVVGFENKPADMEKMRYEVEKALDEGAIGLSLGLIYIPGRFSDFNELSELAKVVKKKNKIVTNHMRSESAYLLEAIDESISIAVSSGVNFEISHLKAAGVGKGKAFLACQKIREAICKGVNIHADFYPYSASNTGLTQVLPPYLLEGSIEDIIKKISEDSEKVAEDIEKYPHTPWDKIFISEAFSEKLKKYLGMSISEISKDMKMSPAMTVIELLKIEDNDLGAIYFLMDQDEVDYIAIQDFVMTASDSAVRNVCTSAFPHPRTFGTFTKFISYYVKEKKSLSLSEAVFKMAYFPALKFNIQGRGLIKKGYFADLVVFDFEKLKDLSTYDNPKRLSEGIKYVFVNGKLSFYDNKVVSKNGIVIYS